MAVRILIRDATVLDGQGIPAYATDVRLLGERIVEVGRGLICGVGERVFDAQGRCLTPDFMASVRSGASRRICAA